MAAVRCFGFVGGRRWTTNEGPFMMGAIPCKNVVLFMGSKFQFLGIWFPQRTSFTPPKGTSLRGMTRFEPALVRAALCICTQAFPTGENLGTFGGPKLPYQTLQEMLCRVGRLNPTRLIQSCPWIGSTHGLGWIGLGRDFLIFGGLGWVVGPKRQKHKNYKSLYALNSSKPPM